MPGASVAVEHADRANCQRDEAHVSDLFFQTRERCGVKVYVSGPYSYGDPCENTHNAIVAGNQLLDAGLVPFVPHISHFWHTMTPRPWEDWMKIDLAFLPACDAFLRLPGKSRGADIEQAEAVRIGIPIFLTFEGLLRWAKVMQASSA